MFIAKKYSAPPYIFYRLTNRNFVSSIPGTYKTKNFRNPGFGIYKMHFLIIYKISYKVFSMKIRPYYERPMIFFAAVVQLVGFFMSLTKTDSSNAFLPYFNIVVPVVNLSCSLICFALVIFHNLKIMQSVVSFIQGIVTTMNNIAFLGIFLYFLGIALLFVNGFLTKKTLRKIFGILSPLFASFFIIMTKSLYDFYMAWMFSLFLMFTYFHIYHSIKESLFTLFPLHAKKISSLNLPNPGEELVLKDYGLTERQIKMTQEFSNGKVSYKELANIFITSQSTIKREMSSICKKLGVENSSLLEVLIEQYKVVFDIPDSEPDSLPET